MRPTIPASSDAGAVGRAFALQCRGALTASSRPLCSGLAGPETNLAAAGQEVLGRGPVRSEFDEAVVKTFSEPARREQGERWGRCSR